MPSDAVEKRFAINVAIQIFQYTKIYHHRCIFEEGWCLLNLVSQPLINDIHVTGVELERQKGVHATFEFDSDVARHDLTPCLLRYTAG